MLLGAGVFACLILYLSLRAIQGPPKEKPYLKILGSGFIYNYRVADVYSGFTAVPQRTFPVGTLMRVSFEDPEGGEDIVVEKRLGLPDRRISIRSPGMRGVKAGVKYRIDIVLLDSEGINTLWEHSIRVSSQIDSEIVPEKPLTVGPGYHRPSPSE